MEEEAEEAAAAEDTAEDEYAMLCVLHAMLSNKQNLADLI